MYLDCKYQGKKWQFIKETILNVKLASNHTQPMHQHRNPQRLDFEVRSGY